MKQVCTIEFMRYVVISLCLINTVRKESKSFITQVHAACESFSIWSYLVVALNGYFHLRWYQPCNYIIFLFWQVPLAYAQSNSKYIFLIKQMCVGKNNSKFLQSYWQVFNAPWKAETHGSLSQMSEAWLLRNVDYSPAHYVTESTWKRHLAF